MLYSKADKLTIREISQSRTSSFPYLIKRIKTIKNKLFSCLLFEKVLANRRVLPVSLLEEHFELVKQLYHELYVVRGYRDCVKVDHVEVPGHFCSDQDVYIFDCEQLHSIVAFLLIVVLQKVKTSLKFMNTFSLRLILPENF